MIEIAGVSRWYGQVIGVNDVTCAIPPGLTALLGQNGAGKSTLIKLITGQLRPTTGTTSVFGSDPFANSGVLKRIGYCPESDSFYEDMTGRQFVSLMGRLSDIPKSSLEDSVDKAIALVHMTERAGTSIASYSKGMRQRIKVAQAIVHEPEILVLDEPLNGLDPVGRRQMMELMQEYTTAGRTVIVSSHILYEVEQMTQHILLLHRGRLLARGDIKEIRSLIDRHPHRIRLEVEEARKLGPELLQLPSVLSVQFDRRNDKAIELETTQPDEFYSQLCEIVVAAKHDVHHLSSPDNNLESVFSYLVRS